MFDTNKKVGKGQINVEKHDADDYDREGFLDVDVNQLRKSKPMTVEEMVGQVSIIWQRDCNKTNLRNALAVLLHEDHN